MAATLFPPHLLCSSTDKQFLLICLSQRRAHARAPTYTLTHKPSHFHAPRSRRSMRIDRVGKGALITGPRVQEKTAENRSLQLFRAAEQNRLPPVSTARAEPRTTDGASRQRGNPLLFVSISHHAPPVSARRTHAQPHRPTIKTLQTNP